MPRIATWSRMPAGGDKLWFRSPPLPFLCLRRALTKEGHLAGIPHQVLMRMFIIEGFKRLKRAG